MNNKKHRMASTRREKISRKTKTKMERRSSMATRSDMVQRGEGQRKMGDSSGGLPPAVEGHSLGDKVIR